MSSIEKQHEAQGPPDTIKVSVKITCDKIDEKEKVCEDKQEHEYGTIDDLPKYEKEVLNHDIKTGYRINHNSWSSVLHSLF